MPVADRFSPGLRGFASGRARGPGPSIGLVVTAEGQIIFGQLGGRGGEAGVPVLGFGGSGVEGGESHHGKLRGAEGGVEALVDGVSFPTAFLPLRGHHGFYG